MQFIATLEYRSEEQWQRQAYVQEGSKWYLFLFILVVGTIICMFKNESCFPVQYY